MTVPKGSIYGLMGVNGAGKTTIIKHLGGYLIPDEGEITIDGQQVLDNEELKRRVAFIPDELFFFKRYSMKDTAKYYKSIYPTWDEARFLEMANDFELNINANIGKFSKGMKKQAAFCLAMAIKPEYLILDEPVDGLDPMMRHQVWGLIMNEVASREVTVLISSHNLRELEDVCDTVGIMNKGRIFMEASLDELKTKLLKVQVSFADETDISALGLEILRQKQSGRVYELIVNGEKDEIKNILDAANPLFVEELPLTLEEIFIYELGEADDDVKQMLI
jgi:ABC-2 type transport system ATP-binding protein